MPMSPSYPVDVFRKRGAWQKCCAAGLRQPFSFAPSNGNRRGIIGPSKFVLFPTIFVGKVSSGMARSALHDSGNVDPYRSRPDFRFDSGHRRYDRQPGGFGHYPDCRTVSVAENRITPNGTECRAECDDRRHSDFWCYLFHLVPEQRQKRPVARAICQRRRSSLNVWQLVICQRSYYRNCPIVDRNLCCHSLANKTGMERSLKTICASLSCVVFWSLKNCLVRRSQTIFT